MPITDVPVAAEAAGYSKKSVHQYGAYVAEELQLKPGGDLFQIVESKLGGDISVLAGSEWQDENISGSIIVNGPNNFHIYVSAYTGQTRDRFTIAHELGHYFLHSRQGEMKIYAERYTPGTTLPVEWEANWFAAGLLMPEEAVKECWEDFPAESYIASVFGVSVDAATYRIEYMKKLSEIRPKTQKSPVWIFQTGLILFCLPMVNCGCFAFQFVSERFQVVAHSIQLPLPVCVMRHFAVAT
jgi:hypothetical protein